MTREKLLEVARDKLAKVRAMATSQKEYEAKFMTVMRWAMFQYAYVTEEM